jgi:hypothetical protein
MSLSCYRVMLTSEIPKVAGPDGVSSAKTDPLGDEFVDVENGYIYVIEEDMRDVTRAFPSATEVIRVGIGHRSE